MIIPDSNIKSFGKVCVRMMTSEPDLVYVTRRIRTCMFIRAYGEDNLKIPPDSPDASFIVDLIAIAFPRGSILNKEFSRV
jgi:hypothetical protein